MCAYVRVCDSILCISSPFKVEIIFTVTDYYICPILSSHAHAQEKKDDLSYYLQTTPQSRSSLERL